MAHAEKARSYWDVVDQELDATGVVLDGTSLTIPQVVRIARGHTRVSISKSPVVAQNLENSIATLKSFLSRHDVVYGVNTGCGGNADTRTNATLKLQHSLIQHQQSGILPEMCLGGQGYGEFSLPDEVVRAIMATRCNSLLRGHSAIRIQVLETLVDAISRGVTPLIPSRGSISASGDLGPLSYVAGLLEGNTDISVSVRGSGGTRSIMSASEGLKHLGMNATTLEAKEGLAILNGTAASSALAALVVYDAHKLAVLCQVLVAMTTEAMRGKKSNFHDFISQVRPHAGQTEVARNISQYLAGSKLCSDTIDHNGMAQDRYALRTAPQWIGPQLEDLLSADMQIQTELNSTTDNPMLDSVSGCLHHGGNFQAMSVTSAMEKTRGALVMLGRLLLGLSGELNHPDLNNGLPPNLCADDPSLSFTCKGIDINMTAYYSELGFLANSVASHVQTAEMNNQTISSLALISGRMTEKAAELLSMMVAGALFLVCQALDLRARDEDFLRQARTAVRDKFDSSFDLCLPDSEMRSETFEVMWSHLSHSWSKTTRLDWGPRCARVAADATASMLDNKKLPSLSKNLSLDAMQKWKSQIDNALVSTYKTNEAKFRKCPSTPKYLGAISATMYNFVRSELAIPFHPGLEHHPPLAMAGECPVPGKTVGTYVTRLYVATRDDSLFGQVMEWWRRNDAEIARAKVSDERVFKN